MRNRTLLLACAVVATACMATSCGDAATTSSATTRSGVSLSPSTTSEPDRCTAQRAGGKLSFGDFRAPTSLDPAGPNTAAGVVGGATMAAIFDVLVRYDAASGKFVPQVAESLESNTDASAWTLKLRSGIRFGNGDPLNAQAVKSSIERFRDPAVRSARAAVVATNIAEIQTPDDLTVVFKLLSPWGTFPWLLAGEGGMVVNTRVVTQLGADFAKLPKGAGVGPYEPVKYVPGEEILLEAKKDYWAGPVCISTLRFVQLNGGPATYDAIKVGSLDMGLVRDAPVVAQARSDKTPMYVETTSLGPEIQINTRAGAPGADVRVRKAIAYALDAQQFDQRVNNGQGQPTKAMIGPKSRFYQNLNGIPYDAAKAKELVQQVTAEGKYDGTLRVLATNSPAGSSGALALQALLNSVGFKANIDLQANTQAKSQAGDFDVNVGATSLSDAAPYIGALRYTAANTVGNIGQFKDTTYDAAVARLKSAKTDDETKAALKDVQEAFNNVVPSVPLGATEEAILSTSKVHGLKFTQANVTLFDTAYLAN